MSNSDSETNEEEINKKNISLFQKKTINKQYNNNLNINNEQSLQILNKKRKRLSDNNFNEELELNKVDDKSNFTLNEYKFNNNNYNDNNKSFNPNPNCLYIGCEDGNIRIIELSNTSFSNNLFNKN